MAVQVPHSTSGAFMASLGRDFAARLTISEEQRARVRGILAKAGVG